MSENGDEKQQGRRRGVISHKISIFILEIINF